MANTPDVKQLLLQVDASVELLRRNLTAGQREVDRFTGNTQRQLDRSDARFGRFGRPLGGVSAPIANARRQIETIGITAGRVERQVQSSSGAMRSALLSSTAAIGAALSVNQIKEYADGYTRFTNQLKVAGLEGGALAKRQGELFVIAQKYGVELESIGGLYGRLTQGAKELGATEADLLKFVGGVGAGLKVQGGSAASTSGAIVQLTQALGGEIVRAEEFNSINEGARPILQAVANGVDRFGGSVAKLRGEVIDGKVTSREFFQGFLKGSAALEQQAAKANFTIGASFTVLNNALGKYIGETDASLSATARVASAIATLAANLDTIIPVLTTIALAYGTVKVSGLAFGAVAGVVATVTGAERALAQQVLLGNASLLSRTQLAARSAELAAAGAATQVAAIEATIAAREAEQVTLGQQIAAERALVTERRLAAQAAAVSLTQGGLNGRTAAIAAQTKANNDASFAAARLATARQRLAVVDGELAVAENSLAGAQARAAAAANASAAATARATLAARAGAAASRLFAGGLTLIGGSVAGGAAVLAIGALVGTLILFRNAAIAAEERNRATATSLKDTSEASQTLNQDLKALAALSSSAASGVAQVGASAAGSTGQMLTFAGAVGEAADKLRDLAIARRREQVLDFATKSVAAERRANEAQARIAARRPVGSSTFGSAGYQVISAADQQANKDDARIVAENRAQQGINYRAAQQAAQIPLEARVRESDRVGGRDIEGDLARVTRDLVVARKRGIRGQVEALEAQKFELTQYKSYRKDGLSPQAAQEAASRDASSFKGATAGAQGDRNAKAGRSARVRADRQAAAEARKGAALVRDAAADERAFSSAERQANNEIAAARADLTNSAVERAQIERDRIESERINRKNEIEQQAKQGGLGVGTAAETRKLELQRLNDTRADLEKQVVDARERQRVADEALSIAQADRGNEVELLQRKAELVTSAGQRRDIELRILAIQYDEERARLEAVVASRETTDAEKKIAQKKLAILGQLQAADKAAVSQRNADPIEQYRQRLLAATGDMREALQGVAADGLSGLEDGLVGLVNRTETVGSAFKKMASSIIADLARIAIQKAILSAVGKSFLGFSKGGEIPGFAGGGSPGGLISGPGSGTSDSILALLSGGGGGAIRVSTDEFIVNAAATRRNLPLLQAINAGRLPGRAMGGLVTPRLPSVAGMSTAGGGGAGGLITVAVTLTDDLSATIDNRAAGVAVQVLRGAAPGLVENAKAATIAALGRPNL